MSILQLEDSLVELTNNNENKDEFIYKLLEIYDLPKATITRLKKGSQNLSKEVDEIHLKNKLWFKRVVNGSVFEGYSVLESKTNELSSKPRYLFVTDFKNLLAKDLKTQETLDIEFKSLPQHFDFFLAWKGIEKIDFEKENPADIKAAERFARLYDVILKDNEELKNNASLNEFLIRVLFCLFAEDTEVFPKNIFTNAIKTFTSEDGSDLNNFFEELFNILNTEERSSVATYLKGFPYVGGQLFNNPHLKVNFSSKARKLIIECGELLNWSKINPDILGSMIQAVASEENRSSLGMHYTSIPNIMKVIKPLFLDELYEAFEKAYNNLEQLKRLYSQIGNIRFFDPACGSGNFLIVTYKELRRLEIKILLRQRELANSVMYLPSVTLEQFYGIEVDDFAHEVAKLSLWIADHQMNKELEEEFGNKVRPTLPLSVPGNIVNENALHIDWLKVCPNPKDNETYIFGNPPYLGQSRQKKNHKDDIKLVFEGIKGNGNLDYIAAWFYLGSKYIKGTKSQLAFVSTNSICQGEQVPILWKEVFANNVQIQFAYDSFKWNNVAKGNAVVTVIIVGLSPIEVKKQKSLLSKLGIKKVQNINAYLVEGENILVEDPKKQLSGLPDILFGSKPTDGGGLIFSIDEYNEIISVYPDLALYFKKYIGADEFIKGNYRYVLWINENDYKTLKNIKIIEERINQVKEFRLSSTTLSTNKAAEKPYAFKQIAPIYKKNLVETDLVSLVIPSTSSSSREYVPMGIFDKFGTILSNSAYGIYDTPLWVLGVLESKMHMIWLAAVGGRLKTDFRYTSLVYNSFPFPNISSRKKNEIEEAILNILDVREEEGSNLALLYGSPNAVTNPKPMNKRLLEVHKILDEIVDNVYRNNGFNSDEERLEFLLNMYKEINN